MVSVVLRDDRTRVERDANRDVGARTVGIANVKDVGPRLLRGGDRQRRSVGIGSYHNKFLVERQLKRRGRARYRDDLLLRRIEVNGCGRNGERGNGGRRRLRDN